MVITLWSGVVIAFIYYRYKNKLQTDAKSIEPVLKTVAQRLGAPAQFEEYFLHKFPKLKYIMTNKLLFDMAKDLYFTRRFDKGRYQDMVAKMDQFQKVYVYILGGRYEPYQYSSILADLSQGILEIMYSYFIIVPDKFKHIYGLDPYAAFDKNIAQFHEMSSSMFEIIKRFAKEASGTKFNPPALDIPTQDNKKYNSLP